MSRPTLYRDGNYPSLTAAHDFAKKHKVSIRKARRMIARLLKTGAMSVYRKQKK